MTRETSDGAIHRLIRNHPEKTLLLLEILTFALGLAIGFELGVQHASPTPGEIPL